jgi:tetratricopeptide (TPR) repeat protein
MNQTPAHDDAITAALKQNWEQAVQLNEAILAQDAKSIDALNRLAFAYQQMGKPQKAKETYEKVLEIDQYNNIAQKNLAKLKSKGPHTGSTSQFVSPLMFLEEPGKTKIVDLVNLAPQPVLTHLCCGQTVVMKVKKHEIEIRDSENTYLGTLPDDVSFKLIRFIEGGNTYSAIIRSAAKNQLAVFLRELTRGSKFATMPSFIPASTFVSSGKVDDSVEKPDTSVTGEEETEEEA